MILPLYRITKFSHDPSEHAYIEAFDEITAIAVLMHHLMDGPTETTPVWEWQTELQARPLRVVHVKGPAC